MSTSLPAPGESPATLSAFSSFAVVLALMASIVVTGSAVPVQAQERLQLDAEAFEHNEPIPTRFTCEGEDISPALSWQHLPEGTETLALLVFDPDVPDPAQPRKQWTHWVLWDIPADIEGLAEGASTSLPEGTQEGLNGWKKTGYGGPCPPIGTHRYIHHLYAVDKKLGPLEASTRRGLMEALAGNVLGRAELMGTYRKRSAEP